MAPPRRALLLTVLVGVLVLLPGAPALADPARPTHFRSTVTAITSAEGADLSGVHAEVVGGDAYLVLTAPGGRTVEVPGYDGEPYLRFRPDGTVQVNTRSPARWLNDARYGDVTVPATADAAAPPAWETVAEDGTYAWHDHRIHFMSPALPPGVDPDAGAPQQVLTWEVPLLLAEVPATITGELDWLPGPGPTVPVLLALLTLVAAGVLVRFGAVGYALLGVAPVTAAVGVWTVQVAPPGSDLEPVLVVLPAVAVASLVLARVVDRGRPGSGRWLANAATLPVLAWGGWWVTTWLRPIAPTSLPVGVLRGVVAAALAVGVAGIVTLVRDLLAATALEDQG